MSYIVPYDKGKQSSWMPRAKSAGATERAGSRAVTDKVRAAPKHAGAMPASLTREFIVAGEAIDPARVADRLGLSISQLAETIGFSPETLYKKPRSEAPKTQSRLREMLEVLNRVSDWAGGTLPAIAWYRAEPIAGFGGRTAESLVKAGEATALRDYLDHIARGGYA